MRSSNGVIIGYLSFVASCVSQTESDKARVPVADAGTGGVSTGGVQGSATGGVGVGNGGATGGAGGSGGSPSSTGGWQSCGGAVAITCEGFHYGPAAKSPELRAAIGTLPLPEAQRARICRNTTCATVDITTAASAPMILFGPADRERVRIAIEDDAGARIMNVSWALSAAEPSLADGDVYSLRLIDAAGRTVRLVKRTATYTRYKKTMYSCGTSTVAESLPCIDVELTDALPELDAGAADAGHEVGSPTDGPKPPPCCPRDPVRPPGDLNDPMHEFCFALGGPDLGGCYKTCGWWRSSAVSAACDAPSHEDFQVGCAAWVADVPDAAAALGQCGVP
jgi:hypothetical protein